MKPPKFIHNYFGLFVCLFLCFGLSAKAQEFSLTQFYTSPLSLNPAFTGLVNGPYRLTGNYRSQFGDVGLGIRTVSASFDAPIKSFGLGVWAHNSSKGAFNNTSANLSTAYQIKLDESGFNRLSIGVQGGIVQKSIGDVTLVDPGDAPTVNTAINPDLNAGIMYYNTSIYNRFNPFAGASVYHILEGAESFYNPAEQPFILERSINAYAGVQWNQKQNFDVVPMVLATLTGEQLRLSGGAIAHYFLKGADASVLVGAHYRLQEAIAVQGGIQYNDFSVGVSYDINLSPLSQAIQGGNDGFEISLIYIKKSKIKSKRDKLCPRL